MTQSLEFLPPEVETDPGDCGDAAGIIIPKEWMSNNLCLKIATERQKPFRYLSLNMPPQGHCEPLSQFALLHGGEGGELFPRLVVRPMYST